VTELAYRKNIGENIRRIRKQRSLTLKELADTVEIEKSNLIPIEKGRVNVTISTLYKLAKALNVEVKEFFEF
jgi:transcriptional regulator with XRE-family HTH domain